MLQNKNNGGGCNIFVYGTLMYDDVLHRIIQDAYKKGVGIAKGFRRLKVIGEDYPGMIPAQEDLFQTVKGVILYQVNKADAKKLDTFEADCYLRETITVEDEYGNKINADTYLVQPDHYHILEKEDWNVELFESGGLKRFSNEYYGFDDV